MLRGQNTLPLPGHQRVRKNWWAIELNVSKHLSSRRRAEGATAKSHSDSAGGS